MSTNPGNETEGTFMQWASTSTETYTTTLSAELGDVIFLAFPTSLPLTTSTLPNDAPSLLILTQLEGILLDANQSPLTTATIVQAPRSSPLPNRTSPNVWVTTPPTDSWATWSAAEKGGVVFAGIVAGVVSVGACVYVCWLAGKRRGQDRRARKRKRGGGRERGRFVRGDEESEGEDEDSNEGSGESRTEADSGTVSEVRGNADERPRRGPRRGAV
ncbi:MAG: hypothetical protein M1833_007231 [Piccolia ochrophora]|nr:MAG: hypothetical protein M1833_007231 [Piccolia ochrophora]